MSTGRLLIFFGVLLAIVGILVEFAPLRLGRLPGDFSFGGPNWRVYIPLGTSILLSIILTLLFTLISSLAARK